MGKIAWSLFETTGILADELTRVGYKVVAFDLRNVDEVRGGVQYVGTNLDTESFEQWGRPALIFGFPPCTDLSRSGARWWPSKALADPMFQHKAVNRVRLVERLAQQFGCPWGVENSVGALTRMWRKPDLYFHPYEYGGYIEGPHPFFPRIYPPRDAYTKKTGLWAGGGLVIPAKRPVPLVSTTAVHYTPPGDDRNKIRSCTPRGFARALAEANAGWTA